MAFHTIGTCKADRWRVLTTLSYLYALSLLLLLRQQQIGLKYYDEFCQRIPRSEVVEIENRVKKIVASINPGLEVVTCGSYRRGRETCGDVDCLVTHPDGISHKGVFQQVSLTKPIILKLILPQL